MVLIFAIYNALTIPFEQAFEPAFVDSLLFKIFDSIVDVVFVADIILGFFTSVTNRNGIESFDSREIKEMYTSTKRFYADVLSVFGMGIFAHIHRYFRGFANAPTCFCVYLKVLCTKYEASHKCSLRI